jgi:hypothetical protein
MKRFPAMTILLGVLVLAFAVPFVLLFGSFLISLMSGGGIHAGSGGFAYSFRFSKTRIGIWFFILVLAIFAFGIAPKLLRRRSSGKPL